MRYGINLKQNKHSIDHNIMKVYLIYASLSSVRYFNGIIQSEIPSFNSLRLHSFRSL